MKKIILEDNEYILEKNYRDGFVYDDLLNIFTDYFSNYDYILGDWAYNKLRLKGFCLKNNELYNEINDYDKIDSYIKQNCAYDCKYFIIKKNGR